MLVVSFEFETTFLPGHTTYTEWTINLIIHQGLTQFGSQTGTQYGTQYFSAITFRFLN